MNDQRIMWCAYCGGWFPISEFNTAGNHAAHRGPARAVYPGEQARAAAGRSADSDPVIQDADHANNPAVGVERADPSAAAPLSGRTSPQHDEQPVEKRGGERRADAPLADMVVSMAGSERRLPCDPRRRESAKPENAPGDAPAAGGGTAGVLSLEDRVREAAWVIAERYCCSCHEDYVFGMHESAHAPDCGAPIAVSEMLAGPLKTLLRALGERDGTTQKETTE